MSFHYIDNQGQEHWKNRKGTYHRVDGGPAYVGARGNEMWYEDGKNHRENNPAIIFTDEIEQWLKNGKLHRIGGPARIEITIEEWVENGKIIKTIYKHGVVNSLFHK